jgi:hypothetical protein
VILSGEDGNGNTGSTTKVDTVYINDSVPCDPDTVYLNDYPPCVPDTVVVNDCPPCDDQFTLGAERITQSAAAARNSSIFSRKKFPVKFME